MKTNKKKPPEYLSFTRKERVGLICIIVIMMVYPSMPFIIAFFSKPEPIDHKAFEKEIAALNIQLEDSSSNFNSRNYNEYNHNYQPSKKKL